MPVIGVLTGGSAGELAKQNHYINKIRKQILEVISVAEYAYGVAVRSAVCPPRVSRATVVIQPRCREHVTRSRSHTGHTPRTLCHETGGSVAKHPQLIATFCASKVLADVAEKYLSRSRQK